MIFRFCAKKKCSPARNLEAIFELIILSSRSSAFQLFFFFVFRFECKISLATLQFVGKFISLDYASSTCRLCARRFQAEQTLPKHAEKFYFFGI